MSTADGPSTQSPSDTGIPKWIILSTIGGFLFWLVVVILSGLGVRFGGPWDFENTGQLGDSFGIISAVMTTAAAIFTFRTLLDTRRQTQLAETEAQTRATELAEDRASTKRAQDEQTFFRLLDQRQTILSHISVTTSGGQYIGPDGVQRIIFNLRQAGYYLGKKIENRYRAAFDNNQDDLGNYFRFTYHIVKFAEDRFGSDAYQYVRFLRAQLTGSELTLIGLNCAFGEGRAKFKPLVERYSLLHEMPSDLRKAFPFDGVFAGSAFSTDGGDQPLAPIYEVEEEA